MTLPMTTVSPGEYLLYCGLIHGHMLCSAPAWPHTQAFEGISAASWTYSHSCFEVYLLQQGLTLKPKSLQRYTFCGTDITTTADALRCTCCGEDILTSTDALGCLDSTWIHPQVTVPLTQAHTGVFQPVQYSSTEMAAMPWPSASPSTSPLLLPECSQAQQSKMISSAAAQHTAKGKS